MKLRAHYPGRSATFAEELQWLRGDWKKLQKSAEGIVVPFDRSEGPNVKKRTETRISMTKGDAERRAEKLETHPG